MSLFCAFLHFGPYIYMYLILGPDVEELTDFPDDQKIQKDYPDTRRTQKNIPNDQKTSETEEDYEDLSGSRPSMFGIPIRHCLLEMLRPQIEC